MTKWTRDIDDRVLLESGGNAARPGVEAGGIGLRAVLKAGSTPCGGVG